jgi:hypothetical protein
LRTALAVLAVVDLADGVLLPVVSLTAGAAPDTLVGTVAGWGVFAVAFLLVADRVYRGVVPDDVRGPGLTILFAGCSLGFGVILDTSGSDSFLRTFALTTTVVTGLFACYVQLASARSLLDPENLLIQPLAYISRTDEDPAEEIRTDLRRDGLLGIAGAAVFVTATGLILMLPCFLAGVTLRFLMQAYPFPDLVAILWVVGPPVARRIPDRVVRRLPTLRTRTDPETRLLRGTRQATRSIAGLFATSFVALALFGATGLVLLGVTLTVELFPSALGAFEQTPVLVWGFVGCVVSLLLAGTVSIWAWVNQYRRLPAVLDAWEGSEPRELNTPRLLAVVPAASVQFFLVAVFLTANELNWVAVGYGVVWPLSAATLCRIVVWTHRRQQHSVSWERALIVGGSLVQLLSLWPAVSVLEHGSAVLTQPIEVLFHPVPVVIGGTAVLVSLFPDIDRLDDSTEIELTPVFLLSMGVIVVASVLYWPTLGEFRALLWPLGLMFVGFSVVLYVVRYVGL